MLILYVQGEAQRVKSQNINVCVAKVRHLNRKICSKPFSESVAELKIEVRWPLYWPTWSLFKECVSCLAFSTGKASLGLEFP